MTSLTGPGGPLTERAAFGPGLRVTRERTGLTLQAIAKSTKIKVSLLAELENNDVSHWPPGIYRRAFFREYLAAIGIASDSLVAEFIRLFPEDGTGVRASAPARLPSELRLTLARPHRATWRAGLTSIAAALIDVCLVLMLAGVMILLTGVGIWAGVGVVALVYFSVATASNSRTPGVAWLTGARPMRTRPAAVPGEAREQPHIVPQPVSVPLGPRSPDALAEDAPPRLRAVSG
ncbi:MAG TPA: helix-turn-helix domain-containing protein [Vicinamibacterales bacterium]|nr:helix-turn-helix domain-containing protein [Vicinamibacterales bacterium]